MKSYYEALGIAENATPAMVKIAYEGKMKALARDAPPQAERKAEERLLQQAFTTLFDPAKKAWYDKQLEREAEREPSSSKGLLIVAALVFLVAVAGGILWTR